MSLILSGSNGLSDVDGSASTPAIRGTDANTGIFFPAADTIAFGEGGSEAMRIDSSGNVGIGTTSPADRLNVVLSSASLGGMRLQNTNASGQSAVSYYNDAGTQKADVWWNNNGSILYFRTLSTDPMVFSTNNTERARITSGGDFLVAGTSSTPAASNVVGFSARSIGLTEISVSNNPVLYVNRKADDGTVVGIYQDGTQEGSISVSGTTVSYNGGHLSRWAQTQGPKDDTLLKGTVLSNLDEMNVYTDAEGNPVDNEQLNKVKVSDVEGDVNVAGVFVNWDYDNAHNVDEINMAMTGDMIIRIAQGVVVQKGDLLMSAGDGTAKPQGDDIVRSKTVAKVTSNHVTCTYEDGSYCVPCVLMAC